MRDLVTAIGLVLVIEGMVWALAPGRLKSVLMVIDRMTPETLRVIGLSSALLGLGLVWLARVVLGAS